MEQSPVPSPKQAGASHTHTGPDLLSIPAATHGLCSSGNENNFLALPAWPYPCLSSQLPPSQMHREGSSGSSCQGRTLKVNPQNQPWGEDFNKKIFLMLQGPVRNCTFLYFAGLPPLKGSCVMVSVESSAGREGICICRGLNQESPKMRVYDPRPVNSKVSRN